MRTSIFSYIAFALIISSMSFATAHAQDTTFVEQASEPKNFIERIVNYFSKEEIAERRAVRVQKRAERKIASFEIVTPESLPVNPVPESNADIESFAIAEPGDVESLATEITSLPELSFENDIFSLDELISIPTTSNLPTHFPEPRPLPQPATLPSVVSYNIDGSITCTIDLEYNSHTCGNNPFVSFVLEPRNHRSIAQVNLAPGKAHPRVIFDAEYYDDQTIDGWTLNIGDSATNNGYGGDSSTQMRDAEAQVQSTKKVGQRFSLWANDYVEEQETTDGNRNITKDGDLPLAGNTLSVTVADEYLAYHVKDERSSEMLASNEFKGDHLFALAGQTDGEGPINYELFVGMNRTVASAFRNGKGLQKLHITVFPYTEQVEHPAQQENTEPTTSASSANEGRPFYVSQTSTTASTNEEPASTVQTQTSNTQVTGLIIRSFTVNGSENPAPVTYNSVLDVAWSAVNGSTCNTYGHFVAGVTEEHWLSPMPGGRGLEGETQLYARHANYGYVPELEIGLQCYNQDGDSAEQLIRVSVEPENTTTSTVETRPAASSVVTPVFSDRTICTVHVNGQPILKTEAKHRRDCYVQTSFGSQNCAVYHDYFTEGRNLLEQYFAGDDRVNHETCVRQGDTSIQGHLFSGSL